MPRALEGAALAALLALAGCRTEPVAPVHLVLGPAATDEVTFTPQSALAELIEVSPTETLLRIQLTSSKCTCDAAAPPTPEEVALALRLTLPGNVKLEPGSFPRGPAADGSPLLVTTVKLRGHRHELRPGGEISLTRIDAVAQGTLEGLLKLEFPGDAEHAATRVSGRFLAHFCKVNRLR